MARYLNIALCMYCLWGYLGPSCLAGLAMMALLVPINALLSVWMKRYQKENMNNKDSR